MAAAHQHGVGEVERPHDVDRDGAPRLARVDRREGDLRAHARRGQVGVRTVRGRTDAAAAASTTARRGRIPLWLKLAYSAFLAEVFRAGLQSVERAQIEAAQAIGLNRWLTFRLV